MKKIYFHIDNHDYLPVGVDFDNISNIENYDNESIHHILIQDLLDYYTDNEIRSLLTTISDKLNPNGLLSIQSIDIKQLCSAVTFGDISVDISKKLLYPNKKSIHEIYDIENLLLELGYKLQQKKYINIFEYYILASKHV